MFVQLKKLKKIFINENRFASYFLYAFGEIFLVVIGILVALKFNDMDLSRQYRQIEVQYYQTMSDQLIEDRASLNQEINDANNRKQVYANGRAIIKTNDREQMGGMGKSALLLVNYGDFRRTSNVFPTLVFSGEIKYIKNKKIIDDLQNIERIYENIERLESVQANLVMTHTAPAILEMVDFETAEVIFPDLLFNPMIANRFSIAIKLVDEKLVDFKKAVRVIDDAIKEIEKELSTNKL